MFTSSSHLLIFTSSLFISSHLLILTFSHLHIFTFSLSLSSPLLIFTSSRLHIFTSSHLHIFTSSLSLSVSCPRFSRSLSFFFFSLLRPQAVPTRRHEVAILTSKRASRHNGVHFLNISTSKSGPTLVCFVHFDFETCFAPQRRAIFHLSSGQMAPHPPLQPTFRPSGATNHWKNRVNRDFSTFSRTCIFSFLTLSSSQIEEVSQNCFVLDAVKLKN